MHKEDLGSPPPILYLFTSNGEEQLSSSQALTGRTLDTSHQQKMKHQHTSCECTKSRRAMPGPAWYYLTLWFCVCVSACLPRPTGSSFINYKTGTKPEEQAESKGQRKVRYQRVNRSGWIERRRQMQRKRPTVQTKTSNWKERGVGSREPRGGVKCFSIHLDKVLVCSRASILNPSGVSGAHRNLGKMQHVEIFPELFEILNSLHTRWGMA